VAVSYNCHGGGAIHVVTKVGAGSLGKNCGTVPVSSVNPMRALIPPLYMGTL